LTLLLAILLLAGAGLSSNPDETRSDHKKADPAPDAVRSRADGLYRRAVAIR